MVDRAVGSHSTEYHIDVPTAGPSRPRDDDELSYTDPDPQPSPNPFRDPSRDFGSVYIELDHPNVRHGYDASSHQAPSDRVRNGSRPDDQNTFTPSSLRGGDLRRLSEEISMPQPEPFNPRLARLRSRASRSSVNRQSGMSFRSSKTLPPLPEGSSDLPLGDNMTTASEATEEPRQLFGHHTESDPSIRKLKRPTKITIAAQKPPTHPSTKSKSKRLGKLRERAATQYHSLRDALSTKLGHRDISAPGTSLPPISEVPTPRSHRFFSRPADDQEKGKGKQPSTDFRKQRQSVGQSWLPTEWSRSDLGGSAGQPSASPVTQPRNSLAPDRLSHSRKPSKASQVSFQSEQDSPSPTPKEEKARYLDPEVSYDDIGDIPSEDLEKSPRISEEKFLEEKIAQDKDLKALLSEKESSDPEQAAQPPPSYTSNPTSIDIPVETEPIANPSRTRTPEKPYSSGIPDLRITSPTSRYSSEMPGKRSVMSQSSMRKRGTTYPREKPLSFREDSETATPTPTATAPVSQVLSNGAADYTVRRPLPQSFPSNSTQAFRVVNLRSDSSQTSSASPEAQQNNNAFTPVLSRANQSGEVTGIDAEQVTAIPAPKPHLISWRSGPIEVQAALYGPNAEEGNELKPEERIVWFEDSGEKEEFANFETDVRGSELEPELGKFAFSHTFDERGGKGVVFMPALARDVNEDEYGATLETFWMTFEEVRATQDLRIMELVAEYDPDAEFLVFLYNLYPNEWRVIEVCPLLFPLDTVPRLWRKKWKAGHPTPAELFLKDEYLNALHSAV